MSDDEEAQIPKRQRFPSFLNSTIPIPFVDNLYIGTTSNFQNCVFQSICNHECHHDKKDEHAKGCDQNSKNCGYWDWLNRWIQPLWQTGRYLLGDLTRGLNLKLKCHYKKAVLPRVTWLGFADNLPIEENFIQLKLESSKRFISIDQFFASEKGIRPLRILVEGRPGYGKTTLMIKIAFDWATDKDYVNHFKLLFILPFRDLQGKSIEEGLAELPSLWGFTRAEVEKIIKDNENETLLIVDGLDESTPKQREDVLKVLYKYIYPKMTVLVTCRTGLFALEREENESLRLGSAISERFEEKHVTVHGIALQQRENFLKKFIFEKDVNEIIRHLKEIIDPNQHSFESPLLLILLAEYVNDHTRTNREITKFTSKTNFYKKIVNLIIRRSEERKKIFLNEEFDVFFHTDCSKSYREFLHDFGGLAMNHIIKNDLRFDCTNLTLKIHHLGLLINHTVLTRTGSSKHFEAFHLSLLEFLVAFYLSLDFHENNYKTFSKRAFSKMNQIFAQYGPTTLVFTFLLGLLEHNALDFFRAMDSSAHLYSSRQIGLWRMFEDIDFTDEDTAAELLSIVGNFMPAHIHSRYDNALSKFYSSNFHKDFVEKGLKSGLIKRVNILNHLSFNLPISSEVPILWFQMQSVKEDKILKNNNNASTLCKCCYVVYWFTDEFSELEDGEKIDEYLDHFKSITAEKRCLGCDDALAPQLLQSLSVGALKNVKIDYMDYQIHTNKSESIELLKEVIENHKLCALKLVVSNHLAFEKLNNLLKNTKELQSLRLFNESGQVVDINLSDLTYGGRKDWLYIALYNGRYVCEDVIDVKSKQFISDSSDKSTITSLKQLTVSLLECFSLPLFHVMVNNWPGYNSLVELVVFLDDKASEKEFWVKLKSIHHLQMLELYMNRPIENLPTEAILDCIFHLPINHLIIWNIEHDLPTFCELILNLRDKRNLHLRKISLYSDLIKSYVDQQVRELQAIVNDLLEYLRCKIIFNVDLLCANMDLWPLIMHNLIEGKNEFKVKHDIFGSDPYDPEFYKFHFKTFLVMRNRFSITLAEKDT